MSSQEHGAAPARRVHIVTLGCARNEVDSEELAGRLGASGWELADEAAADVLVINTCGFIDAAKKDSIDTLLAAADSGKKVVAVGCMAERYGAELAAALPEADAVLGFDSYADIAARLDDVAAGRPVAPHAPGDRRALLPITPVARQQAAPEVALPGHAWLPGARRRLDDNPVAYLKLASGCDRRCSFCAIPSFRGSFISRPPGEILAEAAWLASSSAREIVLVSENSTSYGKDLDASDASGGTAPTLDAVLRQLAAIEGIERVRVAYLQPAELRPGLLAAIATTPGVAPYFDLSFQHSSPAVLRRMRRYGSTEDFLNILERARALAPELGARSNVIVGFPGETEADLAELERFLAAARLDAIGVFGYSDEDGTEAATFEGKLDAAAIAQRVSRISALADELVAQRAAERIGSTVEVLVEAVGGDDGLDQDSGEAGEVTGRAAHQGPEVDGVVLLRGAPAGLRVGQFIRAQVVGTDGADLIAQVQGQPW